MKYVECLKTFYANKNVKFRMPNFPEDISENIVKHIIYKAEGIVCKREKTKGDLISANNEHFEVKSFTSDGPSSFGPKEQWDCLYFLDAKDYVRGRFKLYKIQLPNNDEVFQNVKMNRNQTYGDQCRENRRPRITFSELHKIIPQHVQLIFDGDIYNQLTISGIEKSIEKLSL